MVMKGARVVQPANECSCCGRSFHDGDQAIMIVKVPSAEADTLCLSDWAVILASSTRWLDARPEIGQDGLKSLLIDALTACADEFDL